MAFPGGGSDPIEELSVRLTASGADFIDEIEDAVEEAEEILGGLGDTFEEQLAAKVSQAFAVIEEAAKKAGQKIDEDMGNAIKLTLIAAGRLGDTFEEMEQNIDTLTEGAVQGLKDMGKEAKQFDDIINRLLGRFAKGAIVLTAFRAVSNFLKEGIQNAIEYSAAVTRLEISVRAYQRVQGEAAGTIDEWREFAQQITEKFGGELEQTFIDISASVLLMSRSLSLNKDEIKGIIEAGVILDRVNGDIQGSAERLTDFILTGQVDGLERLGITYTDTLFQQTAFELGIRKTKDEMSEGEKQLIRYNIVLEQTNDLAEDAAAIQDTLAGRLDNVNTSIEESQRAIGNIFLPGWVAVKETVASAIQTFRELIQILTVGLITAFSAGIAAAAAFGAALNEIFKQVEEGTFFAGDVLLVFGETFDQELARLVESGVKRMLGDIETLGDVAEDEFGRAGDAAENMEMQISEAFESAEKAIEEATNKWAEGLEKAQQKLSDRLENIARQTARRRQDLETDLIRDLRDIEIDAARDREETIRDAMIDELRLREDFQRDIRDLESRFLLDLEDAVRDRDARRVLSLQRRFNLEKKKREESFAIQEKRNKENLALELIELEQNLRFQRERRLQAFQEQLADLAVQNIRRQQDARLAFGRELRDLQTNINRRLQLVAEGWAAQLQLNAAGLQGLFSQLNSAYGPGGFVEAFFARFALLTATNALQGISGLFGGLGGLGLPTGIPRRQRGAIGMVASSPTLMLVGERPEIINVSPFNTSTGAPIAGFNRGGNRKEIGLEVSMEDGLVGRIIDQGLDEMADVMVNIKQAGS